MEEKIKIRLRRTMLIFQLLLVYVVVALVWWFILLEKQNKSMYVYQLHHLQTTVNKDAAPDIYQSEFNRITGNYKRNIVKYAGEGVVFLGVILIGAIFIFRGLRKQLLMQQQQQNFMMAVTHELKTPIAVARLNLETLLKHQLEDDKRNRLIRASLDETKRLDFLTNNILVSAQLESRGYDINKEEIDFSSLLQNRVQEFSQRFPDRFINQNIQEAIDVNGDALLLQILINNLLENAIKYSEKSDKIQVTLSRSAGNTVLQVMDEGLGIPDGEHKKIFRKFYRIGSEATRKKQGTGLGLYLCYKITKDHNADILVTNHLPRGSIFTVKFYT